MDSFLIDGQELETGMSMQRKRNFGTDRHRKKPLHGKAASSAVIFLFLLSLGLSLTGCGGTGNSSGFFIQKNVPVPMRDGVVLRADVRRPKATGKYPVLIFRTPYDKNEGDPDNERSFNDAVKRGYAMVICPRFQSWSPGSAKNSVLAPWPSRTSTWPSSWTWPASRAVTAAARAL